MEWVRPSSCSADNGCVETRQVGEQMLIRSSRRPGDTVTVDLDEWQSHVNGIAAEALRAAAKDFRIYDMPLSDEERREPAEPASGEGT